MHGIGAVGEQDDRTGGPLQERGRGSRRLARVEELEVVTTDLDQVRAVQHGVEGMPEHRRRRHHARPAVRVDHDELVGRGVRDDGHGRIRERLEHEPERADMDGAAAESMWLNAIAGVSAAEEVPSIRKR